MVGWHMDTPIDDRPLWAVWGRRLILVVATTIFLLPLSLVAVCAVACLASGLALIDVAVDLRKEFMLEWHR